ncbi:two-CW domain-containing protein [Candidatus Electrothrix sp.]|uniref:two-CW domain-containing protein n=2 Tax=Candidatus Electrothrix sp. TaxID=2170559 RepID=UPI0040576469
MIMNCWEYKLCGREKGGVHAEKKGICPAYPDNGKRCARVAGTLCGGKVQGEFVMKLLSCMKCDFYKSENYDKSYGMNKEIV